jgi:hypothetical protein
MLYGCRAGDEDLMMSLRDWLEPNSIPFSQATVCWRGTRGCEGLGTMPAYVCQVYIQYYPELILRVEYANDVALALTH